MRYDTPQEDLLDELIKLVGRPLPIMQDALSRLLASLSVGFDRQALGALGLFPMTAWRALANGPRVAEALWTAVLSTGLCHEEVLTVLAVVDDYIRRRYGNDAWSRIPDWGPRLAGRYNLPVPPAAQPGLEGAFPPA